MNDLDIQHIAKVLDISQRAVDRLVSSNKIYLQQDSEENSSLVTHEIGLRILRKFFEPDEFPNLNEQEVIDCIRSYATNCAGVYNWVCSGGFSNKKLPATVKPTAVIHACRTASRLRADLIRSSKM